MQGQQFTTGATVDDGGGKKAGTLHAYNRAAEQARDPGASAGGAAAGAHDPALWALTADLLRPDDTTTMLRRVIAAARALLESDGAAILLYEAATGLLVPTVPSVAVGLDERWLQRQGLEAAQTLAQRAAAAHDVLAVLDTATTPELEFPLLPGRRRPGAACAVPLEVEGAVVGVLELYDAAPRAVPYPPEALRAFAALAALAIAQARAHEREQRLRTRLEALDEASKALASDLALEPILQHVVALAATLTGARYGALGAVGADGYLTGFITAGLAPEERARIGPCPRGHGLLGALIRQGKPLRVPVIARDPRRVGFPSQHPHMTSLLGVPIHVRGTLVGALYLTDKDGGQDFSADDQHLMELLAAHAGIAIENARLYAQVGELTLLRERERIGRDLHDGIIQDIYALSLQLEGLAEDQPEAAAQEQLHAAADRLGDVIRALRTYIHDLRAPELEGRLLSEGLAALVREVNGQGGLLATFALEGEPYRLPDAVPNALLHSTREALSNARKHAGATAVHVSLSYTAAGVTLTVVDDGRGFDPELARSEEHRGLPNLRARGMELGGSFSVVSAPGAGATLQMVVPAPQGRA